MKLKLLQTIIMLSKYFAYGVFVQVLLMNLLIAGDSEAQRSKSVKEVAIAIKPQKSSVEKLFREIENLTSFTVSYDRKEIKNKLKQSITVKSSRNIKVSDVLIEIAKQTNLSFRQVNQNISASNAENSIVEQIHIDVLEEVDISGKITDENGQGLPGASVVVKGTTTGTITDFEGNYKLNVPEDAVLVISFIGYKSQEVTLTGRSIINIQMSLDAQKLEEIVVVGYGTQERANVTNAISQIKSASFKDIPVSSVEQGIASQLAGVEVVQNSGRPGQSNQINVRGIGTITAGSQPLIVLDGMPLSQNTFLNVINPNDIESIDVLKDAASASIYGSRGSNGVVLVTTKKGKEGKPQFSFNAYSGIQSISKKLDLMNAEEHAIWDRDARNNYYFQFDDGTFSTNDSNVLREANAAALGFNRRKAIIPSYVQDELNGQGQYDTDWQDELFRKASIQNYQISATGGNEDLSYFVSANYFEQEGIIRGSDFERFSFRSNLKLKLSEKLKLTFNLAPTFIEENVVAEGFNDSPINAIILSLPYFPAYNADGTVAVSQQTTLATEGDQARTESPLAMALNHRDKRVSRHILGSTSLEYEIIEGLKGRTYLGLDLVNRRRDTFRPGAVGTRNQAAPVNPTGQSSFSEHVNWITGNTLNFNRTFSDKHNLDVLVGYSYQQENSASNLVTAADFPNDFVPSLNAGIVNGGNSLSSEWTLVSLISRIQYNYNSKFLFAASIRRDGSSRFGANTKWGVFPSLSAGYRLSEEGFFPSDWIISDLKFRGSWGVTGNNNIPDFGSQALLSSSNAVLDGGVQSGLAATTSPNANLSWEETTTIDVGLDIGIIDEQITASFDYYRARTNDLLLNVPVPAHSGFTTSLQNIGKVENSGIELRLKGVFNLGSVKTTTTFNLAANKNKVVELGPGQEEIISGGRNITRIGEELGASYGYRVQGIWTSQNQIDTSPSLVNAQVGEYIYVDSNDDRIIDADDRVILGSIHPDYSFGINSKLEFKRIDLGIVIQGVEGVHLHNRSNSVLLFNPEGWGNGSKEYFDNYYTPERGESAIYARPNTLPTDNGFYRETDLLQEDASYVRVRNITVGYTLPESIVGKAGISSLRIYFSSKNPITWTDYRGFNPEQRSVGNPLNPTDGWGPYPLEKSFVVGINLNF